MYDIHFDSIETELDKINNLIPITIQDTIRERVVYLRKHVLNGYWAVDLFGNEAKIHPSRTIQVLKIGGRVVQSKKSYEEEKSIYREIEREKKYKSLSHHKKKLQIGEK